MIKNFILSFIKPFCMVLIWFFSFLPGITLTLFLVDKGYVNIDTTKDSSMIAVMSLFIIPFVLYILTRFILGYIAGPALILGLCFAFYDYSDAINKYGKINLIFIVTILYLVLFAIFVLILFMLNKFINVYRNNAILSILVISAAFPGGLANIISTITKWSQLYTHISISIIILVVISLIKLQKDRKNKSEMPIKQNTNHISQTYDTSSDDFKSLF